MQLSPRLFLSLTVGGLLTLTSPHQGVFANNEPAAPEKPAESSAPAKPAESPAPSAAPAKPAENVTPATPTESPAAKPVEAQPAPVVPAVPVTPPAAVVKPELSKPVAPAKAGIQPTAEELRSVELVNQERVKRGLNPLVVDTTLIAVAREHSKEMMDKKYFSHQSPTSALKTPMDRYLKAVPRPEYACVGENLFYCTIVDVNRGHNAFMNSPTHRDNVVFPRYEKIGVGIVKNERGEFWITQMYLTTTDPVQVAKRMGAR